MASDVVVQKVEETVYTFKPVAKHGVDLNALDKKVDSFSALLIILHNLMQELQESSHAAKRQELLKQGKNKISAHVSWKLRFKHLVEIALPILRPDEFVSKYIAEGLSAHHQSGLESASTTYDWVRGEKEDALAELRKLEGKIDEILRQLAAIIQQNVANFR